MTLHDYGLECANGGQRWHPELSLCERLDVNRCAQCTVARTGPALALMRLAGGSSENFGATRPPATAHLRPAAGRTLREGSRRLGIGNAARIEARWRGIRTACNDVDVFLAPSTFIAEELIRFGLARERMRVLPRGLAPATHHVGELPETASRFGYLGSLVPHKGVHVLIEAFRQLPTDCHLTIRGDLRADPVYTARLRSLCRDDRVTLDGPLAREDVSKWLSGLHCLVAPSVWWENHPTSILEAFAAGLPVVGSAIGGQTELLSNGGGLPVPPNDPDALGRALARLATQPGFSSQIAKGIPPVPSEEAHLSMLEQLYRTLAEARRPA